MIVLSVECENDFLSKLTESPNHCLVRLHLQNHVVAIAVGKPEHASFAAICCDKKWEKQPQHTRNPVHLPHKQSAAIIYLTVLSTVVRYYPQRHANMHFRTCDLHGPGTASPRQDSYENTNAAFSLRTREECSITF